MEQRDRFRSRCCRLDLWVALGIAVLAVAARVWVLRATHSTTEDFLITLRYAENLACGRGFVYNPGEHVLGTTTPLYTLALAGAAALHLNAALFGKALNILADSGVCILLVYLFAALGRATVGWFAALLYATTSAPVNFAIGGMETGLVTLAVVASIYAYVTARQRLLWIALALLALLRIDGLLLAALLIVGWKLMGRRYDRCGIGLAALILLPWIVFATFYFGSPIPTSLTAKLIVYGRVRGGTLPNLDEFRKQFAGGPLQIVLLLGFLWGSVLAWRCTPVLRMPLIWALAYYATMLFSKVPAFGWYFVPPLPLYYGLACLAIGTGISEAFGRSGERRSPGAGTWEHEDESPHHPITPSPERLNARTPERLALLALIVLAIPFTYHLRSIARDVAAAQSLEDTVRKPLGIWLARNTRPTERILLEPLGYIGYYSRRPVIDIVGLVSPQVLRYYRSDSPDPLADIVANLKPEWILTGREQAERMGIASETGGDPRVAGTYRFVRAWPDPVNGPAYFVYRRAAPEPSP